MAAFARALLCKRAGQQLAAVRFYPTSLGLLLVGLRVLAAAARLAALWLVCS